MPVPGTVVAGMGRRFAAWSVDTVAVLLVALVPIALGFPELAQTARTEVAGGPPPVVLVGALAVLLLGAVQWWALGTWGWTLGKRLLGLRVVSVTGGAPVGLGRALVRLLVPALAGVVPVLGPTLVHVSPFFDGSGRRQGWHDLAAGTVVLDVSAGLDTTTARRADPDVVSRRLEAVLRADGPGSPPPVSGSTSPARPSGADRTDDGRPDDLPEETRGVAAGGAADVTAPIAVVPTGPAVQTRPDDATRAGESGRPPGLSSQRRIVPPAPEVLTSVPFPSIPLDEEVERTRLRPARTKVPEMASAGAHATVEITDGQRVTFSGTALVGRNPTPRAGEDGCRLIRVADPGRSVSKTHLLLGVDRNGLWIKDRHSTNGTVVTLADGQQILCGADQQVRLPPGASVAFGDYGLSVVTADVV